MEKTEVNGTTIAYEIHGQGEPLLLIHGAGIDHTSWQPQIEPLGKMFQLIVPDVRGHGQSEQTSAPYTIELFAEDMVCLLDKLEIKQTLICGHSMGGPVAQCIAAKHPERVKAIILADTNYGFEDTPFLRLVVALTKPLVRLMKIERMVDMSVRQITDRTDARELFRKSYEPQVANPTNFWNIWQANDNFKGKKQLQEIACPTLVLIAENNNATHKMGRTMANMIPNAKLMTIKNAGHGLNWDNTEDFNAAIIEFCKKSDVH
ncbi:MAG: alpha/beta hydrolase [Anaerolineae bacterium]